MATLTSQLIVQLIDRVSGPAAAATRALRGLIQSSNTRGGAGVGTLRNELQQLGRRTQEVQRAAQSFAGTVGTPAALGVAAAYRTALEYSRELNKATAIGELTEQQRRDVARTSREIGASTQFSAAQAMAMQRALIAAGRTVDQARGMARPILNAALFGDTDPFTAARGVVAITSAYRLHMRTVEEARQQATRVGDIIAKAANESQADFQDLLQGFKYAAPIAHASGWSMEQLAAAIAHMTNNGLRGDEAGVAIRSMLVRMVKPTRDARQAMAELGLSFEQFFNGVKQFNLNNFASGMANAGHRLNAAQRGQIQAAVNRNNALPEGQRQDLGQVLTDAVIGALNIPASRTQDRQKIARAVQLYAMSLAEAVNPDALFEALEKAGATPGQMARIFDARQGSRLMTMFGQGFGEILEKIRREAAGASERGAAQMERDLYGAHKRIQSALEAVVLAIADSGIADRIAEVMNSVSESLRKLAETDPQTLRNLGYAIIGLAAAAPVGLALAGVAAAFSLLGATLKLAAGGLAVFRAALIATGLTSGGAAAGTAAAGAVAGRAGLLRFIPGLGFVMAGAAAGYYGSEALGTVSSVAQGRHWRPESASDVADLQRRAAELEAEIAGIKSRTHPAMAGQPNAQLANLESQLADLRNRVAIGLRDNAGDMQQAGQQLGARVPEGVRSAEAQAREAGAAIGRLIAAGAQAATGAARAMGLAPQARASGGPVSAGSPYIVGERGPELFVPGRSGTIVPNGGAAARGAGTTISINQTFNVAGGANQQELVATLKAEMSRSLSAAVRGLQSDYGLTIA